MSCISLPTEDPFSLSPSCFFHPILRSCHLSLIKFGPPFCIFKRKHSLFFHHFFFFPLSHFSFSLSPLPNNTIIHLKKFSIVFWIFKYGQNQICNCRLLTWNFIIPFLIIYSSFYVSKRVHWRIQRMKNFHRVKWKYFFFFNTCSRIPWFQCW